MSDPYKVLNIPSTATDEEVKKAYRALARKYHPDNYHDNPLADLAQEKMKEINEAYDTITKMRSGGGNGAPRSAYQGDSYGGGYGGRADSNASSAYYQVRVAIDRGDLNTAEHLLNIISDHGPEWNFLKGVICARRGWMEQALQYYETACQMAPGNQEYRQALERLRSNTAGYRPEGYNVFTSSCGGSDFCTRMLCAYCLCNMCGCGGIRLF